MSVLSKTQYKALYGSTGSVFPDNNTEEISEADMRQFGEDTADSFNSVLESNTVESWKSPCAVATTANITLSGEQTIDGVLTSASRVLVKNQTTQSQNGIYVSAAGAWSRATDADADAELEGAAVGVTQGTTQQNTVWLQISDNVTLGSTAIQWQQIGFGFSAGITNSAANNELMKSDGTNAVGSGAYATSTGVGVGTSSPDRKLHAEQDSAATNTVTYVERLTSTSSGTPANGIGVGMEFEVETAAGNNEVGATIEAVTTDVTAGSEDFKLVLKVMGAGSLGADLVEISQSSFIINGGFFQAIQVISQNNAILQGGAEISLNNAVNNGISRPLELQHNTTGTPANGIGAGITFQVETSVSNFEEIAYIDAVVTDVTGGSEDADIVFKTMAGGAAAAEAVRIKSDKSTSFTGPVVFPSYTVAGVPSAASYTGGMIYVTNETGGAVPAFSDGTNWRRCTDRNIIS